ncbi:uncharacterized protein BJX67DRAFT_91620 [Aspergillus lucknowensis]|uniref:Uncharacterized protein n=1 Tax=Aspergillus lucknowensis TaxID=176173 RepID=A0ABR4M5M3_9EURO
MSIETAYQKLQCARSADPSPGLATTILMYRFRASPNLETTNKLRAVIIRAILSLATETSHSTWEPRCGPSFQFVTWLLHSDGTTVRRHLIPAATNADCNASQPSSSNPSSRSSQCTLSGKPTSVLRASTNSSEFEIGPECRRRKVNLRSAVRALTSSHDVRKTWTRIQSSDISSKSNICSSRRREPIGSMSSARQESRLGRLG